MIILSFLWVKQCNYDTYFANLMPFSQVVLGLAHGMILLPVLLAYFGPNCYASVEAHTQKKSKESTLGDVEMPGQLEAQSNKLTEGPSKDQPIGEGQLSPSPAGSSGYEVKQVTG